MRAAAIGLVVGLVLAPSWAFAQANPPPGGGPPPAEATPPPAEATPPPGAMTRDQFVQRRAEAAGRLFDQIDTGHTGYITRAQLRAWMAAHRRSPPPAGPPQQ